MRWQIGPILLLLAACGPAESPGDGGAAPSASAPDPEDPWFSDRAQALGVSEANVSGPPAGKMELVIDGVGCGVAVFDADGDGRMDLYIPNGGRLTGPQRDRLETGPKNALYIQQPDGTFRNEAKARGVDHAGWGFGACAADFDNDGDQDLYVSNLGPNCLYVNDGSGRFRDVAQSAGVAGGAEDWSTGIAVADFDRDGRLDLYVASYADLLKWLRANRNVKRDAAGAILDAAVCDWQGLKVYCGPKGLPGQHDRLYRNAGGEGAALRFADESKARGIAQQTPLYGYQAIFFDADNDGWPDLYVANDTTPALFFHNLCGERFSERAHAYAVALDDMGEDMAGMGLDAADLNGDGFLDICKTNFSAQTNNVYVCEPYEKDGEKAIAYRDASVRTGLRQAVLADLSWSVQLFDYDNDGDDDAFFANGHVYPEVDSPAARRLGTSFDQSNQLFESVGSGETWRFVPKTGALGPDFPIERSSRGAAVLDLEGDGDLDLCVVNLNARPSLLVNQRGKAAGGWLQLRLIGNPKKGSNRDAIGSRLVVRTAKGTRHIQTLRGRGFLGCRDPRVHIGLGAETQVSVFITWPNGERTEHHFVGVNRFEEIRQP